MEGAEQARRRKEALSGGHLCHVCGHQYPNPNPSAKLRRSHRRNCPKVTPAAEEGGGPEVEGAAGERNAGEGLVLGGGRGDAECGNGASEPNGGSALRGSAEEGSESVEDKENAEHASLNNAAFQVITGGCIETGLVDCTNNSSENVNEGNGTSLPRTCTNGNQHKVVKHCSVIAPLAVAHLAEREDSFDEYQDASPFLQQSDRDDGAAVTPKTDIPKEIKSSVPLGTSVAADLTSVDMNGLCEDHLSREPSMTYFPAVSKFENVVECLLGDRDPGLAGPEDSPKFQSTDECSVNIGSNGTDVEVDRESDKTSGCCEFVGDSSLQKCSPLMSDTESQSTCSRKVESFREDGVDVLHIMSEVSPRAKIVGADNIGSETISNSGTNFVPVGDELKLTCTKNTSTNCSAEHSRNLSVMDTSGAQQPVENSCLGDSVCSVLGYQNDLAVANADGMRKFIAEDNCSEGILVKGSELDSFYEERPQQDVNHIITVAERNPSLEKHNGFSKEAVCNRENDTGVGKYQVSASQEHGTLLMDQAAWNKNPFTLDDSRSDDLFELASDSFHLEAPNAFESRQQVDSTSLTASNQTTIAGGQHCLMSDVCMHAVASENLYAVGAEDMTVSTSADPTKDNSLHDCSMNHRMQECESHTGSTTSVPTQVFLSEFGTMPVSEEINSLDTYVEEKIETEDTGVKDMTVVGGINKFEEKKQTEDTGAKEMNAILDLDNIEEGTLAQDTGAELDAVQHTDDVEEKKQAEDTGAKGVSAIRSVGPEGAKVVRAVGSTENIEKKNQTEDRAKKMDTEFNADNVEEKRQADDTSKEEMDEVQHTDSAEEKKQPQETCAKEMNTVQSTDSVKEQKQIEGTSRLNSGRVHVPLKVLLAEASLESKEKRPSTKERVLSFRRRVSKDDTSSAKAGSDDQYWDSPAKLPHDNIDKRSKARKQPWMPFICCHSVH